MKTKILEILKAIIILLHKCDQNEKAIWFEGKQKVLENTTLSLDDYHETLKELKKIIAGMGSFTDLALIPKQEAGIDKKQARLAQWELAEQMDEAIGSELKF